MNLQQSNASTTPNVQSLLQKWFEAQSQTLKIHQELYQEQSFEPEKLQSFCQSMIDYFSFGHLQLQRCLANCYESLHRKLNSENSDLLDQIGLTTDVGLDFDKKYEDPTQINNTAELAKDLPAVGIQLQKRIEHEKELIRRSIDPTHRKWFETLLLQNAL